jgi:hypothetical protein
MKREETHKRLEHFTRTDVLTALRDLERLFANRVEVWRVVINLDGSEGRRIYRGSIYQPRGAEPQERNT